MVMLPNGTVKNILARAVHRSLAIEKAFRLTCRLFLLLLAARDSMDHTINRLGWSAAFIFFSDQHRGKWF
jgi:hypothetical protein